MNYTPPSPGASGLTGRRLWLLIGLPLLAAVVVLALAAGSGAAPTGDGPHLVASGGGEVDLGHVPHLTDTERRAIFQSIDATITQLEAEGQLPETRSTAAVTLGWPLQAGPGQDDPGYHAITGYVDHDTAFPGQLRDYTCGRHTYDTYGGYNHQGTDYYIWPFSWNKMAENAVQVVAAAPGVIVGRIDGNPDQSCTFNNQSWNAVYVRHADGSIAWYGHLKTGSVTPKQIGDTVAAGEYLGVVGSSGNSTGPHLHFELHDAQYNLIDPYGGACNPTAAASWWAEQRPYRDSALNKITTGFAPVSFESCPRQDITNEATEFAPGDIVYFTAYYRDQLGELESTYRILQPDGTVYVEWTHQPPNAYYLTAYWWWAFEFAPTVPGGEWVIEVEFNGATHRHSFNMAAPEQDLSTPTPGPEMTPTPEVTATPETPPSNSQLGPYTNFLPALQAMP